MDLWNMLLGGQRSWLEAALLVCLFWVALIKPERIRSLVMFRAACLLFAISFLVPTLVNLYLFADKAPARLGAVPDPGPGVYLSPIGPLLFTISFIMAIGSVTPRHITVHDAGNREGA